MVFARVQLQPTTTFTTPIMRTYNPNNANKKWNMYPLDYNADTAARYANDIHVAKVTTHMAQMLSTAFNIMFLNSRSASPKCKIDPNIKRKDLYQSVYTNHPIALWIRGHFANYQWAYDYFRALGQEYERRFGIPHAAYEKMKDKLNIQADISVGTPLPPRLVVSKRIMDKYYPKTYPEPIRVDSLSTRAREFLIAEGRIVEGYEYFHSEALTIQALSWSTTIQAYREYYLTDKFHLAQWTAAPLPSWVVGYLENNKDTVALHVSQRTIRGRKVDVCKLVRKEKASPIIILPVGTQLKKTSQEVIMF